MLERLDLDIQREIIKGFHFRTLNILSCVNSFFYTRKNALFRDVFIEQFPHLATREPQNWFDLFCQAVAKEYENLSKEECRAFYIAKKGDVEALQLICNPNNLGVLDILQFCEDSNGRSPLNWMRIKGHQDCLDLVYNCYKNSFKNNAFSQISEFTKEVTFIESYLGFVVCCNQWSVIASIRQDLLKEISNQIFPEKAAKKFEIMLYHTAVRFNHLELVRAQCERGIVPNQNPDGYGKVIFSVIARKHYEMLELLLQQGADPNEVAYISRENLKHCIQKTTSHEKTRSGLINREKKICRLANYTVLYDAVSHNDVPAVILLLAANVDLKNSNNRNLIQQAKILKFPMILALLESVDQREMKIC